MKGFAITAVATLLALLVSGCIQGQASEAPTTAGGQAAPDAAEPAGFDENTGAIEGLVTDDQLQPLPGAQVGIIGTPDRVTVTDVAGRFSLSNLDPGKYQLSANALGYESAARLVEVQAGTLTTVNFALPALPIQEPYHEIFIWSGMIECAVAVIRTTLSAGCDPTQAGSNFHEIYPQGWPVTWNATLVEAEWDSQAQPDWLAFDYNDRPIGYFGVYFRYRGTSPVRFLVERCASYMDTDFGRAPVPCGDEDVNASVMHVETFYNGKFQQETHTFDALCTQNVTSPTGGNVLPGYQAGCYGVGPAVQVRWTNYVTVFHLELPADIDTYSGRPDA